MANRRSGVKKKAKRDNYNVPGLFSNSKCYSTWSRSTRMFLKSTFWKEYDRAYGE